MRIAQVSPLYESVPDIAPHRHKYDVAINVMRRLGDAEVMIVK